MHEGIRYKYSQSRMPERRGICAVYEEAPFVPLTSLAASYTGSVLLHARGADFLFSAAPEKGVRSTEYV